MDCLSKVNVCYHFLADLWQITWIYFASFQSTIVKQDTFLQRNKKYSKTRREKTSNYQINEGSNVLKFT